MLRDLAAAMQIAAATLQLEKSSDSETQAAREREKIRVLGEYAKLSGFGAEEVRTALHEWSTITRGLKQRHPCGLTRTENSVDLEICLSNQLAIMLPRGPR